MTTMAMKKQHELCAEKIKTLADEIQAMDLVDEDSGTSSMQILAKTAIGFSTVVYAKLMKNSGMSEGEARDRLGTRLLEDAMDSIQRIYK